MRLSHACFSLLIYIRGPRDGLGGGGDMISSFVLLPSLSTLSKSLSSVFNDDFSRMIVILRMVAKASLAC